MHSLSSLSFDELPLLPIPAEGYFLSGYFTLFRNSVVTIPPSLQWLGTEMESRLMKLPYSDATPGMIHVDISSTEKEGEQYFLKVTTAGIQLSAGTQEGGIRGMQTLLQLIDGSTSSAGSDATLQCQIPCMEITDKPAFRWRGLMLDVARHFLTMNEVKTFMDIMVRLKFNVLHLHLTDDQGWRVEIKSRPELTRIGAVRRASPTPENPDISDETEYGPFYYSQDMIRDLVEYAQQRCILLVPEIDLPGHVMAALASFPHLGCTGGPYEVRTTWGVENHVLCLGNPDTLSFACDVLSEIAILFPGPYLHIGGDEVLPDEWLRCPRCTEYIKQNGLNGPQEMRSHFTHKLERHLATLGKRAMGWEQILEYAPSPDTVIASSRSVAGASKATARGHSVVMCPFSHYYLDYRMDATPGQRLGAPVGGPISLEKCYSYDPVDPSFTESQSDHILGIQGNLWSEYMWSAKDVYQMAFPRAYAIAETGWSPKERKNYHSFIQRIKRL